MPGKHYCKRCHLSFGCAEERIVVGADRFHVSCFEAFIRNALDTGRVLVLSAKPMLFN